MVAYESFDCNKLIGGLSAATAREGPLPGRGHCQGGATAREGSLPGRGHCQGAATAREGEAADTYKMGFSVQVEAGKTGKICVQYFTTTKMQNPSRKFKG